jgi:type I restriction enzyme M protein
MTQAIKPAVSPEVLFIERCVKWLKPGGRMGIVLPDGILGNPGDEYIRYWILAPLLGARQHRPAGRVFHRRSQRQHPHQPAVPQEEAHAGDPGRAIWARSRITPYSWQLPRKWVSTAVATPLQAPPGRRRDPRRQEHEEKVRIGGRLEVRTLHRKERILDDDLPDIAKAYAEFRANIRSPGK